MNWFGQQTGEGFEYHLLVIGMSLALLIIGGGKWSLDGLIARWFGERAAPSGEEAAGGELRIAHVLRSSMAGPGCFPVLEGQRSTTMLKITLSNTSTGTTFVLSGRLAGPWVDELRTTLGEAGDRSAGPMPYRSPGSDVHR